MKFIHIADVHFDALFSSLGKIDYLIQKRKLEQREAFKKVIDYIKENEIEYLFISGDLYEHNEIKNSTIEYINNLFLEIPYTKIFITPGNHDPFLAESIYDVFQFAKNVKVFKTCDLEKYEDDNIIIYGMAFNDFYMKKNPIDNFVLEKSQKPQILIMHADLNGNIDEEGKLYNPINESKLKQIGFDYVALGHIHKSNFEDDKKIIYPGSLVSLGFDEVGKHGMVIGELIDRKLKTDFIQIDNREFIEHEINIEEFNQQEDLIEYINTLYFENNQLCKLVIKGKRKFLINAKDIEYLMDNPSIIRIKDDTVIGYDLEKIKSENTLKGLFVKKLLEKMDDGFYTKDEIEKAIEIGLEAME